MLPSRGNDPDRFPPEIVRYYRVRRTDLVFLKFILEAYEGMSTLSTVEPKEAIVRLSVPAGFDTDMMELLESLSSEISLQQTDFRPEPEHHA